METNLFTSKDKAEKIVKWIRQYALENKIQSLVVGVSGGVDSGLVSTLCCMTGMPTYLLSLPIRQAEAEFKRATNHIKDLTVKYQNARDIQIDLTESFSVFEKTMLSLNLDSQLGFANSRSRLRMITLYQVASCYNGIVVGTGNKVEDFGVGFYTKYGDGGVDISPIADLKKTEVRQIAREIGIIHEIVNAIPTDGLWGDSRTDEDQIGATYEELEWAMDIEEKNLEISDLENLTDRQREVLKIYKTFHLKNLHKMNPIPVFKL